MTRQVQLFAEPLQTPHVCAKCGVGSTDREFFVDLGVDTIFSFAEANPPGSHWVDGVVYFCNLCYKGLQQDVSEALPGFLKGEQNRHKIESELEAERQEFEVNEVASLTHKLQMLQEENQRLASQIPTAEENPVAATTIDSFLGIPNLDEFNNSDTKVIDNGTDNRDDSDANESDSGSAENDSDTNSDDSGNAEESNDDFKLEGLTLGNKS